MSAGILDGLRIIDLSWGLPGSVATLLLAEAGADVIKVESPRGDPMRPLPSFATWNRSVVLDLDHKPDRAALDELLAGADALVHSLRPTQAARLELDDDTLARRFDQLVWCSVLGYPTGHADASSRPPIQA